MSSDVPTGGNLPPPREGGRKPPTPPPLPLPKLALQEASRIPSGLNDEVQDLAYWGNYILAIPRDQSELLVFDSSGAPDEDFKKISKVGLDFPSISGKQYFNRAKSGKDESDEYLGNFPAHLNIFIQEPVAYVQVSASRSLFAQNKHTKWQILVTNNGKYVLVFHPATKYFIAYQAVNAAGHPLPPRNWIRFDASKIEALPEDLEKTILERQKGIGSKILPVNEEKDVEITDTVIAIRDKSGKVLFTDQVDKVGNNFCTDSNDREIIYYCRATNPVEVIKLEMKGDPTTWKTVAAKIPVRYAWIDGLKMDPTGNFFTAVVPEKGLIILSSDTLQEVGNFAGLRHVSFDKNGDIRAMNAQNEFVVFRTNLEDIARAAKSRRLASKLKGAGDLFKGVAGPEPVAGVLETAQIRTFAHLDSFKKSYEDQIIPVIAKAGTLAELAKFAKALDELRTTLSQSDLSPDEVNYMTVEIGRFLTEKEREVAADEVEATLLEVRDRLGSMDDITTAAELRQKVDDIQGMMSFLDDDVRRDVGNVTSQVAKETTRIFRERGGEIVDEIHGLMESVEAELGGFERQVDFDDWVEFTLPHLKQKIANIANGCPPELPDVNRELLAARRKLNSLRISYEEKLKVDLAQIREKASTKNDETAGVLDDDIEGLLDRLRGKRFGSRIQAEQYVGDSPAYKQLIAEIEVLAGRDPDRAEVLTRKLKVNLAIVYNEIERGSGMRIAETGQQMVKLGETEFPKWEGHVKEKVKHTVDLTWIPDEKTKGAGVGPQDMYGDVALRITDSHGQTKIVRLFEGRDDESDRRYGNLTNRGVGMPPTYMKQKDFRDLKTAFTDWRKGPKSELRKEFEEKRRALRDIYIKGKPEGFQRGEAAYTEWLEDPARKSEFETALKDYAGFCADNRIFTLQEIGRGMANPIVVQNGNGKGYVPEWSSHWVMDNDTEKYLEEMAVMFKMQLDLQEGLLLLKGHAGTGKDVLMKMFCERTRRPYFAIDCTKWTTEFELSEDITLEAEGGASRTVAVPSTVLNAIQTPGAVMYFNEINAMPEEPQIFLHALMDEKRSITLKTKSGKTIKADKSVLLAGSMNPGYKGTFDPQMATRSRMVSIQVDYPPKMREKAPGDPNPNPPYSASEALRIARGVKSLADFTYDPDMKRNDFVKIWDNIVNGIDNGASVMTAVQRFDIETIQALVQFGSNLRGEFIKKFEKGKDARTALPVSQPVTGREMRRCAYILSQMPDSQKLSGNPEQVARNLLKRFFLTHIDGQEDRIKIEQAMASWTSSKRVAI